MLKWLVDAVLGSVLGALVDHLDRRRRDRQLRELGYSQAERDIAHEKLGALEAAKATELVYNRLTPADLDSLRERYRARD